MQAQCTHHSVLLQLLALSPLSLQARGGAGLNTIFLCGMTTVADCGGLRRTAAAWGCLGLTASLAAATAPATDGTLDREFANVASGMYSVVFEADGFFDALQHVTKLAESIG